MYHPGMHRDAILQHGILQSYHTQCSATSRGEGQIDAPPLNMLCFSYILYIYKYILKLWKLYLLSLISLQINKSRVKNASVFFLLSALYILNRHGHDNMYIHNDTHTNCTYICMIYYYCRSLPAFSFSFFCASNVFYMDILAFN